MIQVILHSSEVGLPAFSRGFWQMSACHVPYSFTTDKCLNPGEHNCIFEIGFQPDPGEFRFTFAITAKDTLKSNWFVNFSGDESRKLVKKEAVRLLA